MSLVLILTEERFRDRLEEVTAEVGFRLLEERDFAADLVSSLPALLLQSPDLAITVSERHHPTWAAELEAHGVRYWLVQAGAPAGDALQLPQRQPHRHLLGLDPPSANYLRQLLDDWRERDLVRVDCFTFAYRDGLPAEADWVVDTRFLDSPYWIPDMRPRSGRDPVVREHMMAQPGARRLVENYLPMLVDLLPLYQEQRRSVLRVAVGCTGGRHRSVAIASELVDRINATGLAQGRLLDRPPLHLPQALD